MAAQVNVPHVIPLPPLPANLPTNANYAATVDYVKSTKPLVNGLHLLP